MTMIYVCPKTLTENNEGRVKLEDLAVEDNVTGLKFTVCEEFNKGFLF
jgi:hypothetical protein